MNITPILYKRIKNIRENKQPPKSHQLPKIHKLSPNTAFFFKRETRESAANAGYKSKKTVEIYFFTKMQNV